MNEKIACEIIANNWFCLFYQYYYYLYFIQTTVAFNFIYYLLTSASCNIATWWSSACTYQEVIAAVDSPQIPLKKALQTLFCDNLIDSGQTPSFFLGLHHAHLPWLMMIAFLQLYLRLLCFNSFLFQYWSFLSFTKYSSLYYRCSGLLSSCPWAHKTRTMEYVPSHVFSAQLCQYLRLHPGVAHYPASRSQRGGGVKQTRLNMCTSAHQTGTRLAT